MTQRIERVLDKLYNLKGKNNFVIAEIERNIKRAETAITNATEEQNTNEIKKSDIIEKLTVFNNQKDAFLSAFNDLDDETFSALHDIGVHADFGSMIRAINDKAPGFCGNLNEEIKDYERLIESAKETVTEQAEVVAELEEERRIEDEKRNKLMSLLEQSLSTEEIEREALSTSYVKKILSAFNLFSDDEVVSLAKLIMFPEDGLIEYNDAYDETVAARFNSEESEEPVEEIDVTIDKNDESVSEEKEKTVKSTKEIVLVVEKHEETDEEISIVPTVEEPKDLTISAEEMYQDVISSDEVTDIIEQYEENNTTEISLSSLNANNEEKEIIATIDIPEETKKEDDNSDIDRIIDSLGLESFKVTTELKKLLSQSDYKLIEENYELLRSAYVNDETIYNVVENHNYLVDSDLSKKITLLRAKGISEAKIKELLEKEKCNLRLPIDELENIINRIISQEDRISNENIYKIDIDTKIYDNNKKALEEAGYDLEEKEQRNYSSVISNSPYVPNDIKILKEYLISIIKRNSKYALSVFWKSPTELITDIDQVIEAGLENILETNPEILEENCCELLKRVKYCNENGHQVYASEDKDSYSDYIISYPIFLEKIGNIDEIFTLENDKNDRISDIIGNKEIIDIIIKALNKYYANPLDYKEISITAKDQARHIKQIILKSMGYDDIGKYTYRIKDLLVSKNKLNRNLEIVVDALLDEHKTYEGLEREILLTAMLYNMRIDDETMKKLIDDCIKQGGK